MNVDLTRENFERWLLAKDRGEVVGHARSSHLCPIARYCVEQIPSRSFHHVHVGSGSYAIHTREGRGEDADLPMWAVCFIEHVDQVPLNRNQINMDVSITAQEALDALAEVKR